LPINLPLLLFLPHAERGGDREPAGKGSRFVRRKGNAGLRDARPSPWRPRRDPRWVTRRIEGGFRLHKAQGAGPPRGRPHTLGKGGREGRHDDRGQPGPAGRRRSRLRGRYLREKGEGIGAEALMPMGKNAGLTKNRTNLRICGQSPDLAFLGLALGRQGAAFCPPPSVDGAPDSPRWAL